MRRKILTGLIKNTAVKILEGKSRRRFSRSCKLKVCRYAQDIPAPIFLAIAGYLISLHWSQTFLQECVFAFAYFCVCLTTCNQRAACTLCLFVTRMRNEVKGGLGQWSDKRG